MPRDLFKDGVFDRKSNEDTYSPGDDTLGVTVGRLVNHYHSISDLYSISSRSDPYAAELANIESIVPEDIPGQETFDTFITILSATIDPNKMHLSSGVLTALVQVLYNRGHNDFNIDFEKFRKSEIPGAAFHPGFLCSFLEGTEDNPLKLTYTGNVSQLARDTKFCDFTLIGNATIVGFYAEDCSFTKHGYANQFGYACERSTFREHGTTDYVGLVCKKSRFYLKDYPTWDDVHMCTKTFRKNKNELWLLDESGITYVKVIPK